MLQVTQYTCDFDNLAPSGCTQYFFSENGMGTFQTFNFDGGQHLANQRHKFCFRYIATFNEGKLLHVPGCRVK